MADTLADFRVSGVDIADVAESCSTLEQATAFEEFAARMGPRLGASTYASYFRFRSRAPTIQQFVLRDVVVDMRVGVVFQRGRAIRETLQRAPDRFAPPALEDAAEAPGASRPALAFNGMWFNYCHWLMEALPAAYCALAEGADALVVRRFDPFKDRLAPALDHYGARPITSGPNNPALRLDRLVFTSFLTDCAENRPSRLALALYRRLAEPYAASSPAREVYIRRGNANGARVMENEDELADRLGRMGLEIVELEALPFRQQIALFAASALVVGAHGAGLANLVFCPRSCSVLELLPERIYRPYFAALAAACGVDYTVECHPAHVGDDNANLRWRADIDSVVAQVEDIRARRRGGPCA